MSQTYTIDCFVSTHGGQSDLAIMESNFEALRTTFSGTDAPANAIAGKQWFDTTHKLLKIRNNANSAWLGVLTGTTSLKMLVYRNTAEDGWAIDSTLNTDRVIAIKSAAGTYATGGATAGSWTLPDYTLLEADIPGHTHTGTTAADGAHTHTDDMGTSVAGGAGTRATASSNTGGGNLTTTGGTPATHTHTFTSASTGDGGAHNHGAAYRPAAAVVTIQYPDI